jgi:hypothetical protein|tara:strand:+ start:330 stop:617 length:288 start_codon:yes stop_codon:yes gene_type:complete
MKRVEITPSKIKGKKHTAIFYENNKKIKTTHFGSAGMSDFTINKDEDRKKRYLSRHRARENWNAPMTAGALSRWILWNKKSKRASIADYKKRFNY